MTPNGAILYALIVIVAAMLSASLVGLMVPLALCLAFGLIEAGRRAIKALAWSAGIVLPLAAFMGIVWVGVVGRSPGEIAAGVPGSRQAAFVHVAVICLRLFIIALVIQLARARLNHLTTLEFIRQITAPQVLKKLLVLTLSFIDTILHAVDRSRTALIAANVITARPSLRNFGHGWILVQTVWLSVITIAIGRLRDKWPAEHTVSRLDEALARAQAPPFTGGDLIWIGGALAVAIIALKVG